MYLDLKRFEDMETAASVEKMTEDYTSMFGGRPYEVSGPNQARAWKKRIELLDTRQHVTT
jgi:hypothetical protein